MKFDPISRTEAIETIRSLSISIGGKEIFHPEAKKSVLDALDTLPDLAAAPVWISVNDRLPYTDTEVLCWYRNTDGNCAVVCGRYSLRISPHWETDIDNSEEYIPVEEITHWMPIPKPPKD